MVNKLNGALLKDMILGAAALLEQNKDSLDAMNVFPVPDGDTGTNMSLTMLSAAREVAALSDDGTNIKSVMTALGFGALKGARGNSGVILSQIFAGLTDAIMGMEEGIDTALMAQAFSRGVDFAYKAVMKPKEGTILTVAKSVADAAEAFSLRSQDLYRQLVFMIREGEKTLKKTPDMLPVLKEAGVVDAGGAGFLVLLMGFKAVLKGQITQSSDIFVADGDIADLTSLSVDNGDIEFGYCTEFFIKNIFKGIKERDIDALRNSYSKLGDCVLVVGNIELVKVHVHTNDPGVVLQSALELGELSDIKIDNMREQHRELSDEYAIPPKELKNLAVIAVCSGKGIVDIFRDWQVDGIVEGGQSMNPSTEDILKAIKDANSDNIIVLPNNKNIILAAEQAAEMSDKNVVIIKTKSIPQGISAAVAYDPDVGIDENAARMNKAVSSVHTGQITHAVRDTKLNGIEINKGDLIGLAEGRIVTSGVDVQTVAVDLMKRIIDDNSEIITVYYGENVAAAEAKQVIEAVETAFDSYDIELVDGGQPIYPYIVSVE